MVLDMEVGVSYLVFDIAIWRSETQSIVMDFRECRPRPALNSIDLITFEYGTRDIKLAH